MAATTQAVKYMTSDVDSEFLQNEEIQKKWEKGYEVKMFRKMKNYDGKVPESVINKVDDQEKKIQRLTQAIVQKDIKIKNLEKQNADLAAKYESYINGYAERVEALAEAEREYKKAVADARSLMASYKAKAKAQIEEMRQFNRSIS